MVIGVRGLLHDEPLGRWDGSVVFSLHATLRFHSPPCHIAGSLPDGVTPAGAKTPTKPTNPHACTQSWWLYERGARWKLRCARWWWFRLIRRRRRRHHRQGIENALAQIIHSIRLQPRSVSVCVRLAKSSSWILTHREQVPNLATFALKKAELTLR